jgi:tetratricopeptide (TPR) repeat protein
MAHDYVGQQQAQRGDLDAATAEYREAIRIDPGYAAAHVSLGMALGAQGKNEESISEFRQALRLDPALAAAHNNLAVALEGLGRTDEALTSYFEAVRLSPSDPRTRINLGTMLVSQGRVDEAVSQFRESLRWAPYLPEAHASLGDALLRQGQVAEAIAELRAALLDRPGWAAAADLLAWTLATAGDPKLRDPQEAVRLASDAVRATADSDPRLLRTLAVAQAAAGRPAEAMATGERALTLARASGQQELAADLAERLAVWRKASNPAAP